LLLTASSFDTFVYFVNNSFLYDKGGDDTLLQSHTYFFTTFFLFFRKKTSRV
jgi:hypothetical protein